MKRPALAALAVTALVFGAFPPSAAADPIGPRSGALNVMGIRPLAQISTSARPAGHLVGGLDIVPVEAYSDCASCNSAGRKLGQLSLLGAPPSSHWDDEDMAAEELKFSNGAGGYSSGASYGVGSWAQTAVSPGRRPVTSSARLATSFSKGASSATIVTPPLQFTGGSVTITTPWLSVPVPVVLNGQTFPGGVLQFDLSVLPLPNGSGFQLGFSNIRFDVAPADTVVPEPASAMLLGSGLMMGLGYLRRKRNLG